MGSAVWAWLNGPHRIAAYKLVELVVSESTDLCWLVFSEGVQAEHDGLR